MERRCDQAEDRCGYARVLTILMFTASAALAGLDQESLDVRERATIELVSTGTIPGATGEARLELRIEKGKMQFKARARVEGLTDDLFSLCVDKGFTGDGEAKGGKVDLKLEVDFESLVG